MERELMLEAFAPERRVEWAEDECQEATGEGWTEPDGVMRRARWVLLLGVDGAAEESD